MQCQLHCNGRGQLTTKNKKAADAGTRSDCVRVLGVDTSLRSSGVAVVEVRGNTFVSIESNTIKMPPKRPVSACLACLHRELIDLIERTGPAVASVEGIFYCKNVKTAVTLGHARGVVIAACALAGIPVYEYSPRRVKQAIVGHGSAGKEQVRRMVMSLLNLDSEPDEDVGDALAIAICHLHNRTQHKELAPKQI